LADFAAERVVTEFLWIWITGFSMLVLYFIMFLVMRGWVIIDYSIHWHTTYDHPNTSNPVTPQDQEIRATARMLLFYPGIYIFCFLPNTITRWLTFTNHTAPNKVILFANAIFNFSGFFNFIVFFMTRRAMVVGVPVAGADVELMPPNLPNNGFLPPGIPDSRASEAAVLTTFDNRSSMNTHTSPSSGQRGTMLSHQDDMEVEGRGFLP